MEVLIDGVRYVPAANIPEITDEKIKTLLTQLVTMHYFGEGHKMRGNLYNAVSVLSPELADLMDRDGHAALEFLGVSE